MKAALKHLTLGGFLFALAAPIHGAEWTIDEAQSDFTFDIRHLGLATVTGSFGSFSGTITFDVDQPAVSTVKATIQVGSIDTNNEERDTHLNEADYFNTPRFPVATFTSTAWKQVGKNQYEVTGDLTLLTTTQPVTLAAELLSVTASDGTSTSVWTATTTIDRYDWGIGGKRGFPLGRNVTLTLNITANQQ